MAGPESLGDVAVVLGALILVADQQADRRARGFPLEDPRKNLDSVGLAALRDVPGSAGLAPVELRLDIGLGE